MAQGSEAAVGDGIGQEEFVAAEEVDVTPRDRGEAGDIGGQQGHSRALDVTQGFLHVDGVPVNDGVEGEAEHAELFFLALAKRGSDLATIAVVNPASQPVPQLLPVQLNQRAASEGGIVDGAQDVQRLDDAAELGQGLGQGGGSILDLQRAHDAGGFQVAELERSGEADEVAPVVADQPDIDRPARDGIERPVIGLSGVTTRKCWICPTFENVW